ncbi:SdpI family protein [Alicyclobacillus fructus]|uniref:SdpI family protein n=1 Tax=Alicyclobacillus fructus TaxID=2816082 RepID=UPI001A8C4D9E|nr:SdpI family protein [Alicyclobacillus fructus]
MLGIILLWYVFWWWRRNRRRDASFWETYRYIGGVVVVCMSLIYATVLAHGLHLATLRWAATAYGLMFILVANVLPRLRPNGWIGVRTPWTLVDERVWNWTHRMSGQLGILAGIFIILLAWLLPSLPHVMMIGVLAPVFIWLFVVLVASYLYARRLRRV